MPTPVLEAAGTRAAAQAATPAPVPPSQSVIDLPADQYLHRGAPTEWWWHTGTLRAGDRVFGFEINAASFVGMGGVGFTQVMLTDVARRKHYERTTLFMPPLMFNGATWAEFDPTRDWSVRLGDPGNHVTAIDVVDPGSGYTSDPFVLISGGGGSLAFAVPVRNKDKGTIDSIMLVSPGAGFTSTPDVAILGGGGRGAKARAVHSYVTMNAPWGQALSNMSVRARLEDAATGTVVQLDLRLAQKGPPFIVWGTGVHAMDGTKGDHLQTNNYYYSLTRLAASGSISIGTETLPITGVTWMDHEYGAFTNSGEPVKWILQDMQLDNGVCISNSASLTGPLPAPGERIASVATVQRADGTTYVVATSITGTGRTWTSPASGKTYYLDILVELPDFGAALTVTTLVDAQEFATPMQSVYEGVATAAGTFEGQQVSGTAWNEQALK